MNTLKTTLLIDKNPDKISPDSKLLCIGSQFSNLLAKELVLDQFTTLSNPFGNLYNPISVFHAVSSTVQNKPLNQELMVENNGRWNHYDFHANSGANSKVELIDKLGTIHNETYKSLQKTDFLILTLGSAYVYKLNSKKQVVANCHKTPGHYFTKHLLTPEEIVASFRHMYNSLNHIKNIVLVVSPILQLSDSLTLNTVSKSVLRYACHLIMSEFPFVKYFPAYEFLHSDLRDYSYYESDMVTPTKEAMQYIYGKMKEAYME